MCSRRHSAVAPGISPGRQATADVDMLRGEAMTWKIVADDLALYGPVKAAEFARAEYDVAVARFRAALADVGPNSSVTA